MRFPLLVLATVGLIFLSTCSISNEQVVTPPPSDHTLNISIPTAGNSWVLNNGAYVASDIITSDGVRGWNNPGHRLRTFFHIANPQQISLGIRARVDQGSSRFKISLGNESQEIVLTGTDLEDTYIGDFQIENPGYYFVEIEGLEKEGDTYAEVDAILLGKINASETKYIKDDFYFARRGPSVHLNFPPPAGVEQVEWFYSELNIPQGQDAMGSYFMANGFGEGYFGIQVNSPTERRILFSIWSPYQTDDPASIPDEYKIRLLKKGADVYSGEFGNEGSGGQSYLVFPWKPDVTYGFLIGAKPSNEGHTDYVAYFFDPDRNKWNLIAQFRRPKTNTYLKHLYSFLENFIPDEGVIERRGLYGNQWIYANGQWMELTEATFTADNTARKENRLDYSGGNENGGFYLKNCGFSNDNVAINTVFQRNALGIAPDIDFSSLE